MVTEVVGQCDRGIIFQRVHGVQLVNPVTQAGVDYTGFSRRPVRFSILRPLKSQSSRLPGGQVHVVELRFAGPVGDEDKMFSVRGEGGRNVDTFPVGELFDYFTAAVEYVEVGGAAL
jgi:hypothetical protein